MIEIDRDVWIAAPESMELVESSRKVLPLDSHARISTVDYQNKLLQDFDKPDCPNREELRKVLRQTHQLLINNLWYVCFTLPSGEEKQSADFDSREEALAWLGEIGLNLRPFPFKEKQEVG